MRPLPKLIAVLLLAAPMLVSARCDAQTVDVTAHIVITSQAKHPSHGSSANVVLWLTPLDPSASPPPIRQPQSYTLTQKDKQFSPHILVVPTGSSVNFPNLDPFFHNVFSLFNGKRFDLGLYEGHTSRNVRFDREGVSFIFCNIHPDMGAVVISLSTPFYAVSSADGAVLLQGVPAGRYRLHVWAEDVASNRLDALSRTVLITSADNQLGTLHLEAHGEMMTHHTNKFGESYVPPPSSPY